MTYLHLTKKNGDPIAINFSQTLGFETLKMGTRVMLTADQSLDVQESFDDVMNLVKETDGDPLLEARARNARRHNTVR